MSEKLQGVELIKVLCAAFGPSGCEGEVADLIKEQIADAADKVETDRMGNVYAWVYGTGGEAKKYKVMVAAHMDEVGFIIESVDGDGFLHFSNVGGITGHVLPSKRVTVRGTHKDKDKTVVEKLCGYIAEKPIHLQSGAEYYNAPNASDLAIDIGANNKDDAVKHANEGDYAVFNSEFVLFGAGADGYEHVKMKGKALDDRLGCANMIEVMRKLKESPAENADVCFAFTVREEVGVSGANTAAFKIAPDYAVVLESTAVADIDKAEPNARVAEQGQGGALSLMDRTTLYNKRLVDFTMALAKENKIPCQLKKYVSGGNDAGAIHKSRAGVYTIALSAPSRYIHTPANVVDLRDYDAMKSLVEVFIKNAGRFEDK